MLEEPRAHDVGGVFGQNPPLIFGLFVFAVQQGREVQVYLRDKNQEGGEGSGLHGLDIVTTETKTTNYLSFFFYRWQGQKHLLKSHHGNQI